MFIICESMTIFVIHLLSLGSPTLDNDNEHPIAAMMVTCHCHFPRYFGGQLSSLLSPLYHFPSTRVMTAPFLLLLSSSQPSTRGSFGCGGWLPPWWIGCSLVWTDQTMGELFLGTPVLLSHRITILLVDYKSTINKL